MTHGSLRRRVRATFLLALAASLLVTLIGALAFRSVLDARRDLVDRADPALLASGQLLAGLVDQETGIRGYVISGADSALEPYRRGQRTVQESWDRLVDLSRTFPETARQLDAVEDAVQRWTQDYVDPTLTQVASGDPAADDDAALAAGRVRFDEIRTQVGRLDAQVATERANARGDLNDTTLRLVLALVVAVAVLVAIVGSLWRLVRREVEHPLAELGRDARTVAEGDLQHPVEPVGPDELRELADAMEQMRQRIVWELASVSEARDLLEQRTEDLARSNSELEQFAYVASHDLQEPLRKVASFCQLLQSRYGGQLDERADQYIEFAVDGARRMQDLINDLLEFSRVGRIAREERSVVPAGQLVERAIASLSVVIEESGAVVEVGELPTLQIEPSLGATLFQNLIANGIKFRREGEVPHIRVSSIERTDHHEITVEDDGIGIGPEYAERVFVIFQRLHTKETYGGTGIGLAMCRKIVEHAGGQIWVDPDRALGTAIHLTLPKLEGAPA